MEYCAPTSTDEAVLALADRANAMPLAGGTDLLVQMKLGTRAAARIIDLKRIPELMQLEVGDSGMMLGAAVPGVVLASHALAKRYWPGLVEAVDLIGSSQIQGRCSAGGNLCNASPAADSVPAMIVNQGRCHIVGPGGRRSVAVEEFTTGPGTHCLGEGELLVAIEFPRPAPRSSDAYLRMIPRTEMDIAIAGAAVALTLDTDGTCSAARVAIGAVAPRALLVPAAGTALEGTRLEASALEAAALAASEAASPISDKRGTAEYRRKVVGVLVRRAAVMAKARIESQGEDQ